jgi:hypothetical protein
MYSYHQWFLITYHCQCCLCIIILLCVFMLVCTAGVHPPSCQKSGRIKLCIFQSHQETKAYKSLSSYPFTCDALIFAAVAAAVIWCQIFLVEIIYCKQNIQVMLHIWASQIDGRDVPLYRLMIAWRVVSMIVQNTRVFMIAVLYAYSEMWSIYWNMILSMKCWATTGYHHYHILLPCLPMTGTPKMNKKANKTKGVKNWY